MYKLMTLKKGRTRKGFAFFIEHFNGNQQDGLNYGNNFLLDYPYISDSFLTISYLVLINPTTRPLTFWSVV